MLRDVDVERCLEIDKDPIYPIAKTCGPSGIFYNNQSSSIHTQGASEELMVTP
jgi:hypothetical protein